jgi:hypothetical protein
MFSTRSKVLIGIATALVTADVALSQALRITQGPRISVTGTRKTDRYTESFVAVNPRNPNNIIATAINQGSVHGSHYSDVFLSMDGGKTWTQSTGDTLVFAGADPIVYFDKAGTAYFARYGETVSLSKSTDGGRTWQLSGKIAGSPFDRPFLGFDETGGKFNGRIYAVANGHGADEQTITGGWTHTLALRYSKDSGRTFETGALLTSDPGVEESLVPGDIVVAPDGTVLYIFNSFTNDAKANPDSFGDGHIFVARSSDGGRGLGTMTMTGPTGGLIKATVKHWGPAGFQTWVMGGSPRLAMDLSNGPYRGRLYLTFGDWDAERSQYVIRFLTSSDTGKTWSRPTIVNDDTTRAIMTLPAIAVNKDGVVGVTWYDRRDDPTNRCYRLYFAASTDGGQTFQNVSASPKPSCGTSPANIALYSFPSQDTTPDMSSFRARRTVVVSGGASFMYMSGGHTQGLVADANGVFHAGYISSETGAGEIWHTSFTVSPTSSIVDARADDLTRRVTVQLAKPVIDPVAKTLTVTATLKNISKDPVTGPVTIVLDELSSTLLTNIRAQNSDNKTPSRGAAWTFNDALIASGKESAPKTLVWSFAGMVPMPAEDRRFQFNALKASFVVVPGKK